MGFIPSCCRGHLVCSNGFNDFQTNNFSVMDMGSICIYGSVARKDQDDLSDKDVLILFDGSDRCKQLKRKWTDGGWSVASYTPKRLRKMAHTGSLFVQHLKQEGIILEDTNGILNDILSAYEPKADYSADIDESLSALELLERLPSSHELDYWSADVLHVLLRNLGILRLANEGIYEFAFHNIAQRLSGLQLIALEDLEVFDGLRAAKSAYRSGRLPIAPANTIVEDGLIVLEELFGVSLERSHTLDFMIPDHAHPYFNLRAMEKILVAYNGLPTSYRSALSRSEEKIWRRVMDPRAYSWEVRAKQADLWQLLLDSIGSSPQMGLFKNAGRSVDVYRRGE